MPNWPCSTKGGRHGNQENARRQYRADLGKRCRPAAPYVRERRRPKTSAMPKRKPAADDGVSLLVEGKQHQAAHRRERVWSMHLRPTLSHPTFVQQISLGIWHYLVEQYRGAIKWSGAAASGRALGMHE